MKVDHALVGKMKETEFSDEFSTFDGIKNNPKQLKNSTQRTYDDIGHRLLLLVWKTVKERANMEQYAAVFMYKSRSQFL